MAPFAQIPTFPTSGDHDVLVTWFAAVIIIVLVGTMAPVLLLLIKTNRTSKRTSDVITSQDERVAIIEARTRIGQIANRTETNMEEIAEIKETLASVVMMTPKEVEVLMRENKEAHEYIIGLIHALHPERSWAHEEGH